MVSVADAAVVSAAANVFVSGTATNHDRRQTRADQLSGDTMAMWAAALTSPTVMMALGLRTAQESGGGASRTPNPPIDDRGGGVV